MTNMFLRREENRTVISQVDFHSRFHFQFVRELWIHFCAGGGERLKGFESLEGTIYQHAAGGVRGFTAGFAALNDQDCSSALPQGNRKREADDTAADDDDVPGL